MAKFEDVLERVRDLDEDLAAELEEFKASNLRQKAAERDALEAERNALKAELDEMKSRPAREKAFREYGVDLDQLSKLERKAIEAYDGELTAEAIASFVEENEIAVVESEQEDQAEESGAETIVRTAKRAGAQGSRAPVIKPEDTEDWSTQKLMEFRGKHPEEFEALKRGEAVTGVTA